MKRIDSLTDAQKAQMKPWADKWIKIGLQTGDIDFKTFKEGAEGAYKAAGLDWHNNIVVVDNPLIMALSAPIANFILKTNAVGGAVHDAVGVAVGSAVGSAVGDAVDVAVGSAVGSAVRRAVSAAVGGAVHVAVSAAVSGAVHDAVDGAVHDAVDGAVHDAVDGAVGVAVGSAVGSAVGDAVDGAVGDAVGSAVGSAVRRAVSAAVDGAVGDAVNEAVGEAVRDAVGDAVRDAEIKKYILNNFNLYLGGQFSVGYWYWGNASVTFFRDVCNLVLTDDVMKRMEAYEKINTSACMWYPSKKFIMASKRPSVINRDEQGRLHGENSPSIAWTGFELFHWHGVAIPKEWITDKQSLSAKTAITWENVEQRRAACEIVGWQNVLKELNAIEIDKDDDAEIGTLLEVDLPDSGKERFLSVKCGTGRNFAIPVPPSTKTALEGQSWIHGFDKVNQFLIPEIRT